MSNMRHCRFENTAVDLRDCYENWESLDNLEEDELPNERELEAREEILELAKLIVEIYGEV